MIIRIHKSHLLFLLLIAALTSGGSAYARTTPRKVTRRAAKAKPNAKVKPATKAAAKPTVKEPAAKPQPAFDDWMSETAAPVPGVVKKSVVVAETAKDAPLAAAKEQDIFIPDIKTSPVVVINAITRNDKASDTTLVLAENNAAEMPIVISENTSDATRNVAKDLVKYLSLITGAGFQIQEGGDGSSGIVEAT